MLFFSQECHSAIQCLNDDGDAVDWYWVYKVNDGTKYAYYDSTTDITTLTPSTTKTVEAGDNSCIERTTSQIYSNKDTINWLLYNDENAINGVTNYTCGHSKGMLAFTKVDSSGKKSSEAEDGDDSSSSSSSDVTGFWMIHSAPKFPNISLPSYQYASNAITYGQNFLCVTMDSVDAFNTAAMQLRYITPWVYASNNMNSENTDSLEHWNELLKGNFLNGTSVVNLTSSKVNSHDTQLIFNHLTRSGSLDIDIFESVISPYYGLGFEWETWQDSSSDEPIYCTPDYSYDAEDIEKLTLGDGWYVENKDDHSKFGISIDDNTNIVCTGDMNRATSQEKRGGGYACFKDEKFYDVLKNTITEVESCKSKRKMKK